MKVLHGIYTSTIGSFPLDDSDNNRKRCLEDLLETGIDIPTCPQLVDMGKQFLDDLVRQDCGITAENGIYMLKKKEIGEVTRPPGLEILAWASKYLKQKGIKEKVGLKAAITGPFTLASYIKTNTGKFPFDTAITDRSLVRQLTHILSGSCEGASREASVISIDEPILSVLIGVKMPFGYNDNDVIDTYNQLSKSCGKSLSGTHVCGRISAKLAEILLKTDMDFLGHEFHDSPKNIDAYDPKELQRSAKILSVGCLSSTRPVIETTQEILKNMRKFERFGGNLIFTPDCGFRHLVSEGSKEKGYEIALRKLGNMVRAAAEFKQM